jgi:hypothetical protein
MELKQKGDHVRMLLIEQAKLVFIWRCLNIGAQLDRSAKEASCTFFARLDLADMSEP